MARKTGLVAAIFGFLGLGTLVAVLSGGKKKAVADVNGDTEQRRQSAVRAIRFLVSAAADKRRELILAAQEALRIATTGELDASTYDVFLVAIRGESDAVILTDALSKLRSNPAVPPIPNIQPSTPPEGATDKARAVDAVVKDLETNGANYNRVLMAAAQKLIGVESDGLYGPKTRAALIANGAPETIPQPYFGSKSTPKEPSKPPHGQSGEVSEAVGAIVAELMAKGKDYDKAIMRRAQALIGVNPDGLYGARTREALIKAGAPKTIPQPYFGARKK